jgi:hypothetical protein
MKENEMDLKAFTRPTTVSAALMMAADEIRRLGHCTEAGHYDGPKCPIVAIGKVTIHSGKLLHQALNKLQMTIGPGDDNLIVEWNRRQTQASVIAMLEKAALEGSQ